MSLGKCIMNVAILSISHRRGWCVEDRNIGFQCSLHYLTERHCTDSGPAYCRLWRYDLWHTLVTCERIVTVVFIVTPYLLMYRSCTGIRQSALWSGDVQMACDFLVYNWIHHTPYPHCGGLHSVGTGWWWDTLAIWDYNEDVIIGRATWQARILPRRE